MQPIEAMWSHVEQVLDRALDLEPQARSVFLDQACRQQPALRREVVSLLGQEPAARDFLESPISDYVQRVLPPGSDESDDTWLGTEIAERFVVESVLGRGGMGVVYRATDRKLGKPVAVKRIHPGRLALDEPRQRFDREVRLACRVDHASVARVLDTGQHRGSAYLVMEYVDGLAIGQSSPGSQVTTEDAIELGLQIAKALAAIHGQGLVHRDLKPSNILVTADGYVKVVDFGVAAEVRDPTVVSHDAPTAPARSNLTRVGAIVGTPEYMSPEQLRAERVGVGSDLFSLGIVLFELLTGSHPFRRPSRNETVAAILEAAPGTDAARSRLAATGPLQGIVNRLLEKRATARFSDAAELIEALQTARAELGRPDPPPQPVPQGRTWMRTAVPLLLIVAAVIAWRLWPLSPDPDRPLVAVVPMVDKTGEPDGALTARMFADLLAADLSESPRVRAMDHERVMDVVEVNLAGFNPMAALRKHTAARYLVEGNLYKVGDVYEASLEVRDLRSDRSVGSARVAAGGTAALVDLATVEILNALFPQLPRAEHTDPDTALLTSASEEARKFEYRAREARREYRLRDAIGYLERALEIDAQFLQARIRLAAALDAAGYAGRARTEADLAIRLIDGGVARLTQRIEYEARAVHARIARKSADELQFRRELEQLRRGEIGPLLDLAEVLAVRGGNVEEALSIVQRAIELDPDDPRAHLARADVLGRLRRTDAALREVSVADELFRAMDNSSGSAAAEQRKGTILYRAGRFEEAAAGYDAARQGYAAAGLVALAARAEKSLGDMLLRTGRFAAADVHYRNAAAVAEEYGNASMAINIRDSLGAALVKQRKAGPAEDLLRSAVEDATELDHPRLLVSPLLNLASLLVDLQRQGEGLPMLRRSLQLARETGESGYEIQALKLLGTAALNDGRLEEARTMYGQVVDLQRASPEPRLHLSYALTGIAESFDAEGRVGPALDAINEAIEADRRADNRDLLVYNLTVRAGVWAQLGRRGSAESDLEEATRLDLPAYRPRILVHRARLAFFTGEPTEISAALDAAAAEAIDRNAIVEQAQVEGLRCEWAVRQGRYEDAVGACERALGRGGLSRTERVLASGLLALARLGLGNDPGALSQAQEAISDSRRLGLRLVTARLASGLYSHLASASPGSDQTQALLQTATTALTEHVNSAPDEFRGSLLVGTVVRDIMHRLQLSEIRR